MEEGSRESDFLATDREGRLFCGGSAVGKRALFAGKGRDGLLGFPSLCRGRDGELGEGHLRFLPSIPGSAGEEERLPLSILTMRRPKDSG